MKNPLKNYGSIVCLFLLGITLLASCSKDKSQPDYQTLIVGSWEIRSDIYFQENGKNNREFVMHNTSADVFEFTPDGKIKNEGSSDDSYSISDNQLNVDGIVYTITKLNKKDLVFEILAGRSGAEEYEGRTGSAYCVYTGLKVE